MATVKFKNNTWARGLNRASIKVGWFDTGMHPGYPNRKPSGATVAEVAMFNNRERGEYTRPFIKVFLERLLSTRVILVSLLQDIKTTFELKRFYGTRTGHMLVEMLIDTIVAEPWPENSPSWAAFKSANGLSLHPLIASQIMLDEVRSKVDFYG